MKNTVRLTESDLVRLVRRVIKEQENKSNMFDACKAFDCSDLFNYVMKIKGWDKKYPQMNSNGLSYLQGKNSNGKQITIVVPKKSMNLDIMVNGKQKSFKLPDILQSVIESPNNNELNEILN